MNKLKTAALRRSLQLGVARLLGEHLNTLLRLRLLALPGASNKAVSQCNTPADTSTRRVINLIAIQIKHNHKFIPTLVMYIVVTGWCIHQMQYKTGLTASIFIYQIPISM